MPDASVTPPRTGTTLPWISWWYSAIFGVAILALIGTLVYAASRSDEIYEIVVVDEQGAVLPDSSVWVNEAVYRTDDDGIVRLELTDMPVEISVERPGYIGMVGTLSENSDRHQQVSLTSLTSGAGATNVGDTHDEEAQQIALAFEEAIEEPLSTPDVSEMSPSTPSNVIAASSPVSASSPEVTGRTTNAEGEPVARAWITDGEQFVFSDEEGAFVFAEGTLATDANLEIYASGYHGQTLSLTEATTPLDITLELQMIKGIYYNPNISNTQEDVDRLINIAHTTEVNAIVIDIKEERIFYDTGVQFFQEAGIVSPVLDMPAVLQQFHEHGIYTIARLVVFKDSAIAEKYPHLAVIDNQTGDLWRDMNGVAWVNPMLHELWDVNIELAYEAAMLGFDEIQYDYVRFPTDGDMSRVDYGLENTQEIRERSIESFLQRSYERLIPTGVKQSADVFGYTVVVEDDLGIGQNLSQLVDHVDYLSPMIYPSHWPEGSMALDGHPNDFPYETIQISMQLAKNQLDGNGLKLRPWLQDFNMPGMREYGDAEVRAQIDAVEDHGLAGWLIWDPNNWYHEGAFRPDTSQGTQQATPAATPQAVTRSSGSTRRRHGLRA